MKKLISMLLALIMASSIIPVSSAASAQHIKSYKAEYDSVESFALPESKSLSSQSESKLCSIEESLPSKYDGRTAGILSPVRNQGEYGNCWSHSTMACAETYAIKHFGAAADVDYSEMHNAYFAYSAANDKFGNLDGDGTYIADTETYNYTTVGGNIYTSTLNLAMWQGVVEDSLCPQDLVNFTAPEYNSTVAYARDKLHLTDTQWVKMSDSAYIKSLVQQYGAASTSYYTDDNYYSDNLTNYYDPIARKDSYGNTLTNHGITIIGWDDNYSKTNFKSGSRPTADGAWICKNSWGTDVGENGYIYISYQDANLSAATAAFFDFKEYSRFDDIYQYDGSLNMSAYMVYPSDTAYQANVFECKEDDSALCAASFYTISNNEQYELSIYLNPESSEPTSGTLATTVSGTQEYKGYHTVNLDNAIALTKGEKFAVVVKTITTDGSKAEVLTDVTDNGSNFRTNYVNATQAGQSFLSGDGINWQDRSAPTNAEPFNCRVKAFTTSSHDFNVTVQQADCTNDGGTLYTCKNCSYSYFEKTADALGHDWGEGEVVKAATCVSIGARKYTCSRCGTIQTEVIPINPNSHTGGTSVIDKSEATCTTSGYSGDTVCNGCKKVLIAGQTIAPLGHQWDSGKLIKAATCTDYGKRIYTCPVCKSTYTEELSPLGHRSSGKWITTKTATFTSAGVKVCYCTRCGKVAKSQKYYVSAPKLSYSNVTTTSFTLSWNKISGAKYYRIYQYNTSTKKYNTVKTVSALSYKISNKQSGSNYYYLVRAMKKQGSKWALSAYSSSAHLFRATTACTAPYVTFSGKTSSSFTLNWKYVRGASYYRVYSYNPSNKKYSYLCATAATSYKVSGKSGGTTYYYTVRAVNVNIIGGAYNLRSCLTCPSAPTNVTAKKYSNYINFSWTAPKSATKYRIEILDADGKASILRNPYTTATSVNIEKVSGDSAQYKFCIRAINSSGESTAGYTYFTYD